MALAHTIDDEVEAAYRRGELLEKRRKLMEAWAHYCAKPPASAKEDNVVQLRTVSGASCMKPEKAARSE
jgi:hypothetical protein